MTPGMPSIVFDVRCDGCRRQELAAQCKMDAKLKKDAGWAAQRCQKKVDDGTGLTRLVLEAIRTFGVQVDWGEELVWEADGGNKPGLASG